MRYRHARTGDLGEVVVIDGVERIKRVGVVEQGRIWSRERDSGLWQVEEDRRHFTPAQMASVAFAADRQLCAIIGKHAEGQQQWNHLRDVERREFIAEGINALKHGETRAGLYATIMKKLSEGT